MIERRDRRPAPRNARADGAPRSVPTYGGCSARRSPHRDAGVRGDFAQRGGARLEEPGVEAGPIPIAEWEQRMREREDDVDIRHVEEVPLARGEPALARLRLALRTMPIATRVIGDGLMPAGAHRSRWPPSAAVRQRAIARSTDRCCTLSHGCCSRKMSPCVWRISATSTQAGSCRTRLPLQPRPREDHGRGAPAVAPADSARLADGAARGAGRPWCATDRHGRAGAGSSVGRRRLPADASHTCGAACAASRACRSRPCAWPGTASQITFDVIGASARQPGACRGRR